MRLKGFQKLTPVEKATQLFSKNLNIKKPKPTTIPLHEALNRVSAEDILAKEDIPRFDRSAVDGYAVKAEDTFDASHFKPKTLRLTTRNELTRKQAKQVWTGNPIPKGANAVIMLENVNRSNNKIEAHTSVTPSENISKRGEDIKKGEIAVNTGTRLKPQHLGMLGALGIVDVKVAERPKIAVLATGNELVETGNKRRKDQIFEVNTLILSALCRELDAKPIHLGIANDNIEEIMRKIREGLEKADLTVTTGGTSVGGKDIVPEAVNKIGKPGIIVHGIAMRPAMPTALAVVNGKPIIILPGNPVAAMIGFEVFARPLICSMLGLEKDDGRLTVKAQTTKRVSTVLGRKTFVRFHVLERNGEFFAEPISARGSALISTMTKANGYVVVPENREGLEEGETVSVHLFGNVKVVDGNV